MFKRNLLITALGMVMLSSCSIQKRMAATAEKNKMVREMMHADAAKLDHLQVEMTKKAAANDIDSSITNRITTIITTLQQDLNQIGKTVDAVDFFLQKKKNFRAHPFEDFVKAPVTQLDSFQAHKKTRDRIYQLLNEAVSIHA